MAVVVNSRPFSMQLPKWPSVLVTAGIGPAESGRWTPLQDFVFANLFGCISTVVRVTVSVIEFGVPNCDILARFRTPVARTRDNSTVAVCEQRPPKHRPPSTPAPML